MAQVKPGVTLEDKIARVREAYDAYERGDLGRAKEGYTEDAVFHSQLRGREFKGRDAIFAEAEEQRGEFKPVYKVHDVCASDDHGVALLEMTQEVDGATRRTRLVHVLHLDENGKIKEIWALYNPQG
jgi:ketosteroid isomerase-like protein